MSFFGFDPRGPRSKKKDEMETYNFEDTYEGLGDYPEEEEDAFNAETFGDDINIGKDFKFGTGEEDFAPKSTSNAPSQGKLNFAAVAQQQSAPVDDILQPMASLWGSSETSAQEQQSQQAPQAQANNGSQSQGMMSQAPKVLSLEEIEAQLLGEPMSQPQGQQGQQAQAPFPQGHMFPQPPGGFPNFMIPPGFPPPHMMYNNQQFPFPPPPMGVPPPQFQQQQQHQNAPMPPNFQQPQQNQQQQQQQPPQQSQQAQQHQQQQAPIPSSEASAQQIPPTQQAQAAPVQNFPQASQSSRRPVSKGNVDFPILGSAEAEKSDLRQVSPEFQQPHHPQQHQQQQQRFQHQEYNQRSQQHHQHHQQQRAQYNQNNPNNRDLSPEERERLLRRQDKVARIMRYSGLMNPRDKDFVTRVQLSQIVSEDPYNEDFYYQVFKVINNQGSNHIDGMNSIAQNYLEQSGHRLGGKYKRADVALQRMQQQVSKAVSVAKERGAKQTIYSKEGALGTVSIRTLRQPRTALVIKAKEGDIEINAGDVPHPPTELNISKSSRKFHLYLIEKIFGVTLKLESQEREGETVDTTELETLIFGEKGSNDDSPFVYIFNYEKGIKVFQRFFRFLNYQQKLATIDLIFQNLQKVDVILKSSYKTYEDSIVPAEVNKKVDFFQVNVLKNLVMFLSEATFQEVLNLLINILTKNNFSFLCTSRIGLSILTISISRLELIKEEVGNGVTEDDTTTWSNLYDNLFQQLEGKLTEVFPPSLSSAKEGNTISKEDDSYIWQFLASLALAGKLNHQRIIVDEIRDEIFGVQKRARDEIAANNFDGANKLIANLNLFLNVMGLKANENDISELN